LRVQDGPENPAPELTCVFCRQKPRDPRWRPFCSERCKLRDLAQWACGGYRVPGRAVEAVDDEDIENEDD
jgi:uncharacterized protein